MFASQTCAKRKTPGKGQLLPWTLRNAGAGEHVRSAPGPDSHDGSSYLVCTLKWSFAVPEAGALCGHLHAIWDFLQDFLQWLPGNTITFFMKAQHSQDGKTCKTSKLPALRVSQLLSGPTPLLLKRANGSDLGIGDDGFRTV